ncbi:hypothetical protein BGX34_003607 [Mortierella sp. NVP85]|nr:hypothetical protein BGX34_003607 [Mortierella sp. NVP85]
MGKLYPSCIASNSRDVYFIVNAQMTVGDPKSDPGQLVLVKSSSSYTDPDSASWTVVSTVPIESPQFQRLGTYSRSKSEHTTCVVDDNGVFALSTGFGEGTMYTILFDPERPGNSNVDKWPVLDSVPVQQNNREFYLFFAGDTKNSSSTLHHVYYDHTFATPTGTDNTITFYLRIGRLLQGSWTAPRTQPFSLDGGKDGNLKRMFVGNGSLYVDIARPTSSNGEASITRDLSAYPLSSLIVPGSVPPPKITPLSLKGCEYPISAASGGLIYTICNNVEYDELTIVNGAELLSARKINRPPTPNSIYYRLELAPSPPGKLAPVAFLTTQTAIYTVRLEGDTLAYSRFQEVVVAEFFETRDGTPMSEGIGTTAIIIICIVACLGLFGGLFLFSRRRRRQQIASKEELAVECASNDKLNVK